MRVSSQIEAKADLDFGAIRTVLVVDDSRLQRRILVASLKKWGFTVVEADSGEEAIEICKKGLPDLVLSDWVMRAWAGWNSAARFARWRTTSIPISSF